MEDIFKMFLVFSKGQATTKRLFAGGLLAFKRPQNDLKHLITYIFQEIGALGDEISLENHPRSHLLLGPQKTYIKPMGWSPTVAKIRPAFRRGL